MLNSSSKSLYYGSFLSITRQIRFFYSKPRFDLSCIRGPNDAIALFQKMVSIQPRPSVIDFTRLLSAVVKMKQFNVALHLFGGMLQRNAPVNDYTLNIAIDCFCRLRRADFGFAILGRFFKLGYEPDLVTFNTLIRGLLLVKKIDEAEKLLKKMVAHELYPNVITCSTTYNILLDGLCSARRIVEAFSILHIMQDKGINPDIVTYSILIEGLCNDNRVREAKDLFYELPSKGLQPDVVAYTILIGALCEEGQIDKAHDLLSEMVKKGCFPNSVTYKVLSRGLLRRNMMHEASSLLEEMISRGFTLDATSFSTLIQHLETGCGDSVTLHKVEKLVPTRDWTAGSHLRSLTYASHFSSWLSVTTPGN